MMMQKQSSIMDNIYQAIEGNQVREPEKTAGHFQTVAERQEAKRQWALQFEQLIDTWDEPIFQMLNRLAQLRWPPKYILGLIPVSTYRLRDEQVDEVHLWWVEHDISPRDKYQCAAYQVCLVLDKQGQPELTVQSGTRAYSVRPLTIENVQAAVAKMGQDPPLIIPRKMGKVRD